MKNLIWGIFHGWLGGTGVAVFPLLITLVTDGDFSALDDLGGVGRYVLWCYTAGTVGGAIVGASRRFLKSALGRAVVTGLVVTAGFGTQILMLWGGEDLANILYFTLPMTFVLGFVMSPLLSKAALHWPSVDGFLDGLVLRSDPEVEETGEDADIG